MNPLLIFSKDNLQAEPRGALTHSFTRGRVTTAPVLSCQLSSLPLLCKYCLRLQPSRREETVSFRVSSPLTYADEGEDKCTAVKSLFSICLQPVIRISISLLEDFGGMPGLSWSPPAWLEASGWSQTAMWWMSPISWSVSSPSLQFGGGVKTVFTGRCVC